MNIFFHHSKDKHFSNDGMSFLCGEGIMKDNE
jgi:hypothetical protein